MNPFASVQVCTVESLEDTIQLSRYSAVIYGFRTFKEAVLINRICRQQNVPFYLLNTSGLFGFFYIDVGQDLTFVHHKKQTETDENHIIKDSRTI